LNREDVVTVYSILDFVEEYKITIDGEIKSLVFMITVTNLNGGSLRKRVVRHYV
jgi:hypothetical protein